METKRLKISSLELNNGQIEGLPANPRQWTGEDVKRIAASLKETPELFEMRPCIVTPCNGKYVILAGSLRYCGAKENGDKDVPAVIFEGDIRKMQEIILKDNGSFGAWDMDALANEWDELPLAEWGVPTWNVKIDEAAVDGLFEEAGEGKHKPIVVRVEIPLELAEVEQDIRASLGLTLTQWKGCKVK